MKCEIIRDLLPSYIDGLTCTESNEVIETHLSECQECKKYLHEMQEDINDTNSTKKDIDPFLKIKRDSLRKIILAVFIALTLGAVSLELWHGYWNNGKSTFSDEMTISCEKEGDITRLVFTPTNDNTLLQVGFYENKEINGVIPYDTLGVIKYNAKPSNDERVVRACYDLIFLDENTFIDLNHYPSIIDVEEDDVLAIEFNEKTFLINICDLYHGIVTEY